MTLRFSSSDSNANIRDILSRTVSQFADSRQPLIYNKVNTEHLSHPTGTHFINSRQFLHNFFSRFLSALIAHCHARVLFIYFWLLCVAKSKRAPSKTRAKKFKLCLSFFIFLFNALFLNAQGEKDSLVPKWELGLAPGYIYTYPTFDNYSNNKNSSLGGINVYMKYKVRKHIHFTFGLSYDLLGYEGSRYYYSISYPTLSGNYSESFKYSLLNLPAQININIRMRKFNFSVSPGITISRLLHNEYTRIYPAGFSGNQYFDSGNTMIVFASLSSSISFKATNNITLFSEAEIVKAITPIFYITENYYNFPQPYTVQTKSADYVQYYKISLGIFYALKKNKKT